MKSTSLVPRASLTGNRWLVSRLRRSRPPPNRAPPAIPAHMSAAARESRSTPAWIGSGHRRDAAVISAEILIYRVAFAVALDARRTAQRTADISAQGCQADYHGDETNGFRYKGSSCVADSDKHAPRNNWRSALTPKGTSRSFPASILHLPTL
jgi:hypothetical protein